MSDETRADARTIADGSLNLSGKHRRPADPRRVRAATPRSPCFTDRQGVMPWPRRGRTGCSLPRRGQAGRHPWLRDPDAAWKPIAGAASRDEVVGPLTHFALGTIRNGYLWQNQTLVRA